MLQMSEFGGKMMSVGPEDRLSLSFLGSHLTGHVETVTFRQAGTLFSTSTMKSYLAAALGGKLNGCLLTPAYCPAAHLEHSWFTHTYSNTLIICFPCSLPPYGQLCDPKHTFHTPKFPFDAALITLTLLSSPVFFSWWCWAPLWTHFKLNLMNCSSIYFPRS